MWNLLIFKFCLMLLVSFFFLSEDVHAHTHTHTHTHIFTAGCNSALEGSLEDSSVQGLETPVHKYWGLAWPGLSPVCLKSGHRIASRVRDVGWTSVSVQSSFLAFVTPSDSTPALSLQIAVLPMQPTPATTNLEGTNPCLCKWLVGTAVLCSLSRGSCHAEGRCNDSSSWEHDKTQPSGGFSIRQDSLKVTSVLYWGEPGPGPVCTAWETNVPSHPTMLCGPQGCDLGSPIRRPPVAVQLNHILSHSCVISVLMLCPEAL